MGATLKDIAIAIGVNASTVSIALRGGPRAEELTAETRRRVHEVARHLNYRPNVFARQLKTAKSKILMVCLNYIFDPWAGKVVEGFEMRAAELGYRVLITGLHDREKAVELQREVLGGHGIQGIACVGGMTAMLSDTGLLELANDQVKIMLVSRTLDDPRIGWVVGDDYAGATLAAEHLFELGLRDIWIAGWMAFEQAAVRVKAFQDVAAKYNAGPLRVIEIPDGPAVSTTRDQLTILLKKNSAPQGLLGVTDSIALGAIHAFLDAGLKVGSEVAVVGYDDGPIASNSWPALTTIHHPLQAQGRAAADGLINQLERPDEEPLRLVLPQHLVVRESSSFAHGSR